MSPELSMHQIIDENEALETAFRDTVDPSIFTAVLARLDLLNLNIPSHSVKKLITYLMPAMKKVQVRDKRYTEIRNLNFTTKTGRRFYKELS